MLVFPLVMAGLGLGIALWVAKRPMPVPEPPKVQRSEGAILPATQLEGLGYLPADTNIAFAMQPGAVVTYARTTNQDVRELIIKAGIPARVVDSLTNLGITLGQIDHIAGGTCVGNAAVEVRLTMVLTLRQELDDEDNFLEHLKAKHQPGGKDRYEVKFGDLPMTLARVSSTVWVFGFDAKKDLEAVDKGGYGAGANQFPAGLRDTLLQQVPAGAAAWVVTNDERWSEKPGVKFVIENLLKKPEWLPVLAQGRAGMAAITFSEQPRVRLYVKTADAATGLRVRNYFAERAGTDDKIQHGGDGESAFFDSPIDPAKAFATIQQFLSDTPKK